MQSVTPLNGGIGTDLKLLALGARILGPVAPALAGGIAYRLWFRTVRPPDPPEALPALSSADRSTIDVDGRSVVTYAWGKGPTVILVHGWSSHTGYMTRFVDPLLEHGFGVLAFDAPGHGRSPGQSSDIFQFSRSLRAVADTRPSLRGIVAHSLGSLAVLDARPSDLEADACVLISPGVHLDPLVAAFADRVGLTERTADALQRRVVSFIGSDYYEQLWAGGAPTSLVVHDRDDDEIPWTEGSRVARKLDAARLHATDGLGHRRILRDPEVVARTIRFIDRA